LEAASSAFVKGIFMLRSAPRAWKLARKQNSRFFLARLYFHVGFLPLGPLDAAPEWEHFF
jgi:hypothetical protein